MRKGTIIGWWCKEQLYKNRGKNNRRREISWVRYRHNVHQRKYKQQLLQEMLKNHYGT